MASSSRRDDEGPSFPAKAPCFFKIVLESALRDGKLEIPEVVVVKHGNCLADCVFLKVPSGAVWKIGLARCCGKVWLQKGWQEFAKFYSINHGNLLVFSYEGDCSHFQVRIFHRNNLEMEYPFSSSQDEEANLRGGFQLLKKEKLGDDVSIIIMDSPPPKTREKTALISPRPHKMMRTNSSDKVKTKETSNPGGETKGKGHGMKHHMEKKSHGSPISPKKRGGGEGGMSTAGLRARAFLRAMSFESNNPFLVVKMQPTYLTSLRLCVSFVKKHVCAKGVCDMNLQILDGRTWPVKCLVVKYGRRYSARVYDGWIAFVRENRVKVGDACVFELIEKGRKVTLKVGIYRANDAN